MARAKKTKAAVATNPDIPDSLQVAKRAGVSIVTVSRALNNSKLVSSLTRDRVLAAAKEIGYRPNPVARALRTQKSNALGIVLKAEHLAGPFYAELLAGIHSIVHQRDMSVLLIIAPEKEDTLRWLLQNVRGAAFDGVILHHEVVREIGVSAFRSLQFPAVMAGILDSSNSKLRDLGAVGFDHADAVQQAVRYLVALGHKRIAWFDSPQVSRPGQRERTFRESMAEARVILKEEWVLALESDSEPNAGAQAIRQVFSGKAPYPTAVLCGTDLIAAGVIEGAMQWGRSVPQDLSVLGYGDGPWASVITPPLTTLHQSAFELGQALASKILARIDGAPEGRNLTALSMPLVVRASTARPPA